MEQTSFARIIVTPLLLLVAAFLVTMVVPDYGLAVFATAAVLGIGYVLFASRRGK